MNYFRNEYRVVPTIEGDGFDSHFRPWWWPFWQRLPYYEMTVERAEAKCRRHSGQNDVYLGKLP